jgi:hypothetical protein
MVLYEVLVVWLQPLPLAPAEDVVGVCVIGWERAGRQVYKCLSGSQARVVDAILDLWRHTLPLAPAGHVVGICMMGQADSEKKANKAM